MKATWENVKQDYHFTPEKVIVGLNGYFECKHEKTYITIHDTLDTPVFLDADFWLDALIEWLRKEHYIFYRPGLTLDQVEAARNAAKMCCLRAHIKDEISKRGLWCTAEEDIPALVDTLFKAYDECSKARDRNRENATKLSEVTLELRKELNALKDAESKVRSRLNNKFCALGYEDDLEKLVDIALRAVEARDETINRLTRPWHDECKDIMNYIRQEASRNGFDLPEEIDGGPLTIKRVFHDLLELLRKKEDQRKAVNEHLETRIKSIFDKCKSEFTVDDYVTVDPTISFMLDCISSWISSTADIREKTRNEVFYYIIGTYQKHGLDPSDIYSPNNPLEDVIYRLIVRYEAKVKLCNQLKQEGVDRNEVIKKLKELLNEINKEEDGEWFKP